MSSGERMSEMDRSPDLTGQVRVEIYKYIVAHTVVPTIEKLSQVINQPLGAIQNAVRLLADAHALVLQPTGEILMANPFSAVPTGFEVTIGKRKWWGNCIWDSLGIVSAVGGDGDVDTACGCCGLAMRVQVRQQDVLGVGIVHFAIPARHWWDDIVFN